MSSRVYHNVLSPVEIQEILDFYKPQADANTEQWVVNKNLEYHIPDNFIYKLLNSKLTAILGEHEFATGAYKECIRPYPLHVDTYEAHESLNTVTTFHTQTKHNIALLMPLVDGPEFKTVTFKLYSKKNNFYPIPEEWLTDTNTLNPTDFDHDGVANLFPRMPLDVEYTWHKGDILTWNRDQLHVSANFARNGSIKKFLVMFIA